MTSAVFGAQHAATDATVTAVAGRAAAGGAGGSVDDRVATSAPVKGPACVLSDEEFVKFTALIQGIAVRIAELDGIITSSSERLRDTRELLEEAQKKNNEAAVKSYTGMGNNTEAHRAIFLKERNELLAYRRSANWQAHGREAMSGEFKVLIGREVDAAPTAAPVVPPLAMPAATPAPLASPRPTLAQMEATLRARREALEGLAPSGDEAAFVPAPSAAAPAPLTSPRLMLPAEAALLARQAALEDRAPSGREVDCFDLLSAVAPAKGGSGRSVGSSTTVTVSEGSAGTPGADRKPATDSAVRP